MTGGDVILSYLKILSHLILILNPFGYRYPSFPPGATLHIYFHSAVAILTTSFIYLPYIHTTLSVVYTHPTESEYLLYLLIIPLLIFFYVDHTSRKLSRTIYSEGTDIQEQIKLV
jgi:hypothetical protein